jgi:hypothetical protein
MKDKKQIALALLAADVGLSIWSYQLIKNYDAYVKIVSPMIDSPDFQVQLYAVLLQSFIFSILLFLSFHLIIYFLFLRDVKYATKYVRFYSFMAAISAFVMALTGYPLAIIPMLIYIMSFVGSKKFVKK